MYLKYTSKTNFRLISNLFYRVLSRVHHLTGLIFGTIVEKLLAAVFLLISVPLFIVIPITIKMQDGGPVFFLSRRLGRHKRPFNMYKFRSLSLNAEHKIGGQFLHHSHNLELPIGGFLRDTRLDEIPQLLNVLLGHMQFLGPRPERPSLYEKQCAHIPGYDRRFDVKPGLFGYSQLFTPHSTPKRIRTLIDNRYIYKDENIGFTTLWTVWSMLFLLLRFIQKAFRVARMRFLLRWKLSRSADYRALKRVSTTGIKTIVKDGANNEPNSVQLVDINDEYMFLRSDKPLLDTSLDISLIMKPCAKRSPKRTGKTARVRGIVSRQKEIQDDSFKYAYVVNYSAISPLNRYFIDKYLLKNSIK
jgi:lipopolysaccharide/colanic/teichoic acid biosynthesis glycosyltransferase